jgi:hypothetical protein
MNKSVILTLDGPNIDLLPGAISGTILNNNGFYPSLGSSCTESGHAKSEFRKIRILIFLSADTLARNPDNLSDEIVEDAVPTAVGFISIFHPE